MPRLGTLSATSAEDKVNVGDWADVPTRNLLMMNSRQYVPVLEAFGFFKT